MQTREKPKLDLGTLTTEYIGKKSTTWETV